MAPTEDFYRERAAEALSQAGESNLDNVKERCLRSAEAWSSMANRVRRTARLRDETLKRKAAEREAALEAETAFDAEPVLQAEAAFVS